MPSVSSHGDLRLPGAAAAREINTSSPINPRTLGFMGLLMARPERPLRGFYLPLTASGLKPWNALVQSFWPGRHSTRACRLAAGQATGSQRGRSAHSAPAVKREFLLTPEQPRTRACLSPAPGCRPR